MKLENLYFVLIIFSITIIERVCGIIQMHREPTDLYFGRNKTSLNAIENNMNIFALQAIMTDFLNQITVLNSHVDLGLITDHITDLKNQIEYSDLNATKSEEFRKKIVQILETNQIIKSWEHFRSHIIVDYLPFVKKYLKMQFSDFSKLMYNIKNRRSFIKVLKIFQKINARKFDIIAIFMYWYDAITFYRYNLLASELVRKALFERLVLEQPHWSSIFREAAT